MSGTDSLIFDLGDCGLFQVLIVVIVHGAAISSVWSNIFMAYGNYNPGWTCSQNSSFRSSPYGDSSFQSNISLKSHQIGNVSFQGTSNISFGYTTMLNIPANFTRTCENYMMCDTATYDEDSSTIVTEWDLGCGNSWILSLMISLQSGGYIFGILIAGFLMNEIGRKPTHIFAMTLHVIFNTLAVFSVNWPMFAAIRFFLGFTAASVTMTNFVYPMEFLTNKWRAIVASLPFTNLGGVLFAIAAMVLRDWKYLHIATAALTAVLLISALWFPESIRWLAITGNTEKAVHVVHTIAKVNGQKTDNFETIVSVLDIESKSEVDTRKNTVLDLYRHGFAIRTSVMAYSWMCYNVCLTILQFGITSLSGNFYINLIVACLIPGIVLPVLPFIANALGRKICTMIILSVSVILCIGLVALDFVANESIKYTGRVVIVFILIAVVHAHSSLVYLVCVEMYPTYLRSFAFSYCSSVSRVAGMLAPFLIPHDEGSAFISHIVMTVLLFINLVLSRFLPETNGRELDDYVPLED